MEIEITIEDDLYNSALELADPKMDAAGIINEALAVFVRVQTAKRLAAWVESLIAFDPGTFPHIAFDFDLGCAYRIKYSEKR